MTDQMTEAILDATRASIVDFGIRRTSLTEIARRAGVSRMTVYRRYPDVDAILRDLMTREFGELMRGLFAAPEGDDGRARTVWLIATGVQQLRDYPLLRKVVDAEPELMIPYLLGQIGGSQRQARVLLAESIAAGQADGSIRDGDPLVMASSLLLTSQSFLYSGGTIDDMTTDVLDGELARIADASLAPDGPAPTGR